MKSPRYVVLTVDYEIFGNGTGDVRRHMIEPSRHMAELGDAHGTPFTFFVEMEEYLAFERFARPLREELGYDPAALIRAQVASLVDRGHDVQLHLHPQWHGAEYQNGEWNLRLDRLTVDALFENQQDASSYIGARMSSLQELAAGQEIRVYRAGGFAAQPGVKLLGALAENGFLIDSSVVKGLHFADEHVRTDYRQAPEGKRVWRVEDEVNVEHPTGRILEIPIHGVMGRRFQQLTLQRMRAKFARQVPRNQKKKMVNQLGIRRTPAGLARFLCRRIPIKLDFHNVSPETLLRWIRKAEHSHEDPLDVVVLIGHSKEHVGNEHLGRLLAGLNADPDIEVVTFGKLSDLLASDACSEHARFAAINR